LFLSAKQTLSFQGNKLVLSGIFNKSEISFSEIKNIESGILNKIVQKIGIATIFIPHGGGFAYWGSMGLRINNKNSAKPFILLKYNFSNNWEEIINLIQEKSKKTIKEI
jgi:hypothetical protein